jgi:hypothetical protein
VLRSRSRKAQHHFGVPELQSDAAPTLTFMFGIKEKKNNILQQFSLGMPRISGRPDNPAFF